MREGRGRTRPLIVAGSEDIESTIGRQRPRSFFAVTIAKSEEVIQLATLGFDFDHRKAKVEWRMADGKPFAVIMRIPKYGETDEDNPYIGKKIGEQLIIKGLKGFEKIDFTVDAKTPKANQKARDLADQGFQQK